MTSVPTQEHQSKRPTVMLVDGFGLIFRAYHAFPEGLRTSSGEEVGAVYGFALMLLEVLRTQQPDHAVVALEGGRTFRHDAYDGYKANRAEMPDEFKRQVEVIVELIEALNIPIIVREGYEADDVIGSLATKLSKEGNCHVLIVTGDNDLLQLVDDNVTVVLPGRRSFGELRTFDRDAVIERYGVGPELVTDYKALVGDTSDNVPGVKGIGDKGARALLQQYGPIENIYQHINEITPARTQKALIAGQQDAFESKKLVTIVRDLDVDLDWERSEIGNYDRGKVFDLFRRLEFRTLLNRLPEVSFKQQKADPVKLDSKRTIVRDEETLRRLADRIREVKRAAVDVETTDTDPMRADLVGISIAVATEESYYVPVGHTGPEAGAQLPMETVREVLTPALTDPSVAIITHHGKYDLLVLRRNGMDLAPITFDTMIAAYLLGETSLGLKHLAFTKLGIEMTEISELIGKGRNQLTMDTVSSELVGQYACGDVEATLALAEALEPIIKERDQIRLLTEVELPLIPVLVEMERTGITVDVPYLHQFSAELAERMKELESLIYEAAGHPFSIGSNKQLATVLFDELGLTPGRKTKTGYSVDADELERLRGSHPIVEYILEHRSIAKLKSTYVDALPQAVNPVTGRVHTSFNQTIAATGRLSSTNPNLQNIPIRTEQGRRVRHAFVADTRPEYRLFPDAVLLSADYSQIELRLLAHMSGEPFLVEAFQRGEDIHTATAAIVYGVKPEEVTPNMRRVAKTVNFGVMYGMQAFGLSRDSGLSQAEAQAFISQYWDRLPKVRALFDEILRQGTIHGYVSTEMGRRRYLPDLTSTNGQRRMAAERMAVNMPLQGMAADIMKIAMIRVDKALRESGVRAAMLLQVHDELVLEVAREDLAETAKIVQDTMQHAAELRVPLVAEVSVGPRWDEMEPLELAMSAAG